MTLVDRARQALSLLDLTSLNNDDTDAVMRDASYGEFVSGVSRSAAEICRYQAPSAQDRRAL